MDKEEHKQSNINNDKGKIDIKHSGSSKDNNSNKTIENKEVEEKMEVHVKPKEHNEVKIKHFLYEFFIIFLAVSVSFFVENIRERYLDHHKETQYIQSLVNDVKIDTLEITRIIKKNTDQIKGISIFLEKLENPDSSKKTINYIYYYSITYLNTLENFANTDRTITQLKNAGGLRLIENKAVSDSIVNYDAIVNDIKVNSDLCLKFFYDLLGEQKTLLDFKQIRSNNFSLLLDDPNLKLLKNDSYSLSLYYNNALSYASLLNGYVRKLENLKKHSIYLLKTIDKEYDIK